MNPVTAHYSGNEGTGFQSPTPPSGYWRQQSKGPHRSTPGFDPNSIRPGLSQKDFKLIASGGFGDGLNNYAHSMAWFKESLYVATMRGNFPLMRYRLPIGMNPWPVPCPDNPFDLDLRAEIWRYHPGRDVWKRVFKSPVITGSHGKRIPRDLSYRGMVVYQPDHRSQPELYVSTWSPAKGPGPLLLRSEDGNKFEPVCKPGLMGLPVTTIRSLIQFKGRLFTTPAGSRGGNPNISAHSVVYESRDPANGHWYPINEFGFGDAGNQSIFEIAACGDHLYAGTFNLEGFQVWRTTAEGKAPYHWDRVLERGAYRGKDNQCVMSMYPFKGALYLGSGIQGGGVDRQHKVGPASPELIRLHPDGSWDLLVGAARDTPFGRKHPLSGYLPGFDNGFNGYFWRMCEHDDWLYLSTFDWSCALIYADRQTWPKPFIHIVDHLGDRYILKYYAGFDLYRSPDGENWVPVTTNGMNNPYNMGLRTMASTPLGMFLGTANPFGPKFIPIGGTHYIHNPRGGCEVFWAVRTQKHGELKSG